MTEDDYVTAVVPSDPRWCMIKDMDDLNSGGELSQAIPMRSRFPRNPSLKLSDEDGDLITDFINNIHDILIPSEKAKRILEEEGVGKDHAEYLPIVLRDKRGKTIKEEFFIMNLLTAVDCFDWERSTYRTYPGRPRELLRLKVLHVHPEAIPPDAKVFRVGEWRHDMVVRKDLLQRLQREGCDGLRVIPMGQRRLI